MFLAHPFSFLARYWEVYQMHVDHVSAETAERRKQKVEDVRKRSEYRKAHGLETGGLGGWEAKREGEEMGPALREGGDVSHNVSRSETNLDLTAAAVGTVEAPSEQETYVDFEGRKQPARKKWFGIW